MPSWHLTGDKVMEYITAVNDRQETKRQENEKYKTAKKEAVKKVKSEERKSKKKVTRLTGPHLNAPKGKRVSQLHRRK